MNKFIFNSTIVVLLTFGLSCISNKIVAQCSNSDINIEIITAYNFIDDSNIQTPAGIPVTAAHIGAKFCNTSGSARSDVFAYVGTYTGSGNGTPGTYESTTWPGLTGTFALEHSADKSDATRYVGDLAAGECVVQYWLIEYPNLDGAGNPVYGACSDETDDLKLDYNIWTTFSDGGSPASNCYNDDTRSATIRCEITASANKIWPNGDNKVPDEYIQLLADQGYDLGWDLSETLVAAGQVKAVNGIWYDLGNVNQGFDNDGDFVPDYNAWMQPVGNPELYDPNCFRLVKTHGFLIVKTNTDDDIVIPFEDQLYFENLPPSNTGVVGVVFYEYIAISGPCTATLTPYQEVASGSNNEKFNADFGMGVPITSLPPTITIDKSVDSTVLSFPPDPATLTYTLQVNNAGPETAGAPQYGVPIVISDAIPGGTTFKAGSMSTTSGSYSFRKLYSTDNGATWVTTEPTPASSVTDIQWWMNEPLAASDNASVTFQVEVASGTVGALVHNIAGVSIANNPPLDEDDAITLIAGTNSIGDTVFVDNGTGGGVHGNGIADGSEPGISGVTVFLYYDIDGDSIITEKDILYDSTDTDVNGKYLFENLADGDFIVKVDKDDVIGNPTYAGSNLTTDELFTTNLAGGASYMEADFGFAPPIDVTKSVVSNDTVLEGQEVTFEIKVDNLLASPGGEESGTCNVYDLWVQHDGKGDYTPSDSLYNEPDGQFASGNWGNLVNAGVFTVPPNSASIVKVELVAQIYYTGGPIVDDNWIFRIIEDGNFTGYPNHSIPVAEFTAFNSRANAGEISVDVTADRANWQWSDFTNTYNVGMGAYLQASSNGSGDGALPYIDAVGYRITTDEVCSGGAQAIDLNTTLNPVPVKDIYNSDSLIFISSSIAPSSIDEANGEIVWNNIGPLNAGESKSITVTFEAKEPANGISGTTTNTGLVSNAYFMNGDPAPADTSTISVVIEARGTISGLIWSDECTGNSGVYDTGTDGLIEGVDIVLYGCVHDNGYLITPSSPSYDGTRSCTSAQNDGNWVALDTVQTAPDGTYLFKSVDEGHYYTQILSSSLPAGQSQTADPDAATNDQWCSGNGGSISADLNTFNDLTLNEDITAIDFGYSISPIIYGHIFERIGTDTIPLNGITVNLNPGGLSTTSDANGSYTFEGLTASTTYTISVTTPGGATWTLDWSPTTNPVTVCAGEISGPQDFGYVRTGSSTIGDTLFYDINGNGLQEANEEGMDTITIYIIRDVDEDGKYTAGVDIYVDTTTTNANGYYKSDTLPAGEYLVRVDETDSDMPAGFQTTDPDESGGSCSVCDGISTVTLNGSTSDILQDFGYQPVGTGSIGDVVWNDRDGNGSKIATEPGLDSVNVILYADLNGDGIFVVMDTVVTDSVGGYVFENLPDGSYRVDVDTDDPDIPTTLVSSNYSSYDVSIVNGQTDNSTLSCTACPMDADFAFSTYSSIGDMVYWDANNNGTQDWTEQGIANITVELYNASTGSLVSTTTTSDGSGSTPAGYYIFEDLPSGDYVVVVDDSDADLNGASQTADPNSGGFACDDPQLVSLGYPACDHRDTVDVSYGSSTLGVDFGYQPAGVIGDWIWNDVNGDGIQDIGEAGISNVKVYLCTSSSPCTSTSLDLVDSTQTDFDGYYSFSNIPDASYNISIVPPSGYTATSGAQSVGSTTTSLIISGNVITHIGGSACTDCDLDVDFGLKLTGSQSISGNLCIDASPEDGLCDDPGDSPTDSIDVYLYRFNGSSWEYMGSTQTDVNGAYQFDGLPDGQYIVSMSTENTPFDKAILETDNADSPSGDIQEVGTSVYHNNLTISGAPITDADFAYSLPALDYGDLPAGYEVSLTDNGPRHEVDGSWYLGSGLDGESDGVNSVNADSDDLSGGADDGIEFLDYGNWMPGQQACIKVTYTVPSGETAYINGWIDWGQDGSFAGDMIADTSFLSGNSPDTICFTVPTNYSSTGTHFAVRFRLFEEAQPFPALSYSGAPPGTAQSGEVEDQLLSLAVLPVELSAFNAQKENCNVRLSWTAESELNFSHYELQRSSNGISFRTIKSIQAVSRDQTPTYQYLDEATGKINYYRLKMVDLDGRIDYSKTLNVNVNCYDDKDMIIFPNPAIHEQHTVLSVKLYSQNEETTLLITDLMGRTIKKMLLPTSKEWNVIRIDITDLAAGAYFIQHQRMDGTREVKQFLLQR